MAGDEILSSSPQEAAHLIAKLQPGILPGGQAMESLDHARHQHLSRRLLEELERLAAADDIPALRGKRPETVRRTAPPLAPLDSGLEDEVYEPRRRPRENSTVVIGKPSHRTSPRRKMSLSSKMMSPT